MSKNNNLVIVTSKGETKQMTKVKSRISEQVFKGLQQDYTIGYSDGSKMNVQFTNTVN